MVHNLGHHFLIFEILESGGRIKNKIPKIVQSIKQVAQGAMIAHLSPMCQGQISFQKTYKWAMETRGPKSNASDLLCLSWLPATLLTI